MVNLFLVSERLLFKEVGKQNQSLNSARVSYALIEPLAR
jgi:hypothetical protein